MYFKEFRLWRLLDRRNKTTASLSYFLWRTGTHSSSRLLRQTRPFWKPKEASSERKEAVILILAKRNSISFFRNWSFLLSEKDHVSVIQKMKPKGRSWMSVLWKNGKTFKIDCMKLTHLKCLEEFVELLLLIFCLCLVLQFLNYLCSLASVCFRASRSSEL